MSNKELFKQALVEGVNRHIDKTIEEEKQIEEMAKIIYDNRPIPEIWQEDAEEIANILYNAEYRKQSEGEWIRHKEDCLYNKCSICSYEHCREDNFCPNCGAKMKGGAE